MNNRTQSFPANTVIRVANSSGSAYAAGKAVQIGSLIGIVHDTIADGATGTAQTTGRFELKKQTGVAYTKDQILSYDFANDRVTTDLSSGVLVRVATAALSADTIVECDINALARPREFCKVITPSAGEDSANQMDVDVGFATTGCFVTVWIVNSSGVYRVPGTLTTNPGGSSPNVLRIAESNIAATDKVHVLVRQV